MIDYQILFPLLIFLPALLGFVGCVLPKITFPISVLLLLGYAAGSFKSIGNDLAYQFTLVGNGGIQFSVDSYSYRIPHWRDMGEALRSTVLTFQS